ncbi:MAG: hypothetical protein J5I50_13835 [Chitinophagaceae bacterium]|nr:hypothetical protein [Chitinophagaceae bacterium]
MKPILKIQFTDFWPDFNPKDNLFLNLLKPNYEVVLSGEPDILIYSVYSFNHLKYKCPKIFYTAENVRPDFHECDFALTFDYESYKGMNIRLPLYRWRSDLKNLCARRKPEEILKEKTKFCCMVVSNGTAKERNSFFELLSQYKQVDSGGRYLNNVGGPVADKMEFIENYKFVLSFENSCYPGYTTEKIVEPMIVDSIPVYWGNPEIGRDFNSKSFINIHDFPSYEKAIEEIIKIDKDDELYRSYLMRPWFKDNSFPQELEYSYFEMRMAEVVNHLLQSQPVAEKLIYKPYTFLNKKKKKLLSRIYGRPHFYF